MRKALLLLILILMYSREGLDSKGIISDLQGPVFNDSIYGAECRILYYGGEF